MLTVTANGLPPGPSLPRVAQAWLWNYRYEQFTARAHKRYGETFTARIGGLPTAVVTTNRDAVRRLFTGDPLSKRHGNDVLRPFVGDHSVLVLEPADHVARRKLLLPPFHGERVQGYARLMERLVDAELQRWRDGETIEIQPIAQNLTLDVILQAVLGIADVPTRRQLREIFDAIINPLSSLVTYLPGLSAPTWWNPAARQFWALKDKLDALLFGHIAATRSDPRLEERDDILAMLVLARDEAGEGLTDPELRDELVTLISAGHETTATAIAWAVEMLGHTPAVLARARTAAVDGDEAYLDALVKETLRIRPPIPLGGARRTTEPFVLGHWSIPAGVTLVVDGYGLHHDPAIYADPEAFEPERFVDAPRDAYAYAFLPFGGGAHRCIGAALAQLEMKVVLRALLERFDIEPDNPKLAAVARRGVTMAPRGGARIRVRSQATRVPVPA